GLLERWTSGGRASEPRLVPVEAGRLLELPLASAVILGFPLAHVGDLVRYLPYRMTRRLMDGLDGFEHGVVLRIRSWEIDPYQPRILTSPVARIRHYKGLARTLSVLERLLEDFSLTCIRDRYGLGETPWTPGRVRRKGTMG
ncbi:MAG TPA: DUF3473 domain-containing protein, partial [Gemmatimonadota bacterium]|nr:DUF3473 domain-containing protein [Gemmatimonadota bacterium]